MSLFRHFALNHHKRATLKILKSYCFALGAWTVNHANKTVLKISLSTKKRSWMVGIFSQIKELKTPFDYSNAKPIVILSEHEIPQENLFAL